MLHAFLYISLPSLNDYNVTRRGVTRFMEDVNSFSFSDLRYSPLDFNSRRIPHEVKREQARTNFQSDVFAAVAVVVT